MDLDQGHFVARTLISKLLGVEMAKIRVTASEIGGGFGGKTTMHMRSLSLSAFLKRRDAGPNSYDAL